MSGKIQTCAAAAALAVTLVAAPASAQSNGAYSGTLACERTATARAESRVPFALTVEGGQAAFAREATAVDGSPMGVEEKGGGSIAPDGALVLAATVEAGSFRYESRYEGRLGEQSGRLAGTQTWQLPDGRATRKCTLTLNRRAAPRPRR